MFFIEIYIYYKSFIRRNNQRLLVCIWSRSMNCVYVCDIIRYKYFIIEGLMRTNFSCSCMFVASLFRLIRFILFLLIFHEKERLFITPFSSCYIFTSNSFSLISKNVFWPLNLVVITWHLQTGTTSNNTLSRCARNLISNCINILW